MRRPSLSDVVTCLLSLCELAAWHVAELPGASRQTSVRVVLAVIRTALGVCSQSIRVEKEHVVSYFIIIYVCFICFGNHFLLFLYTSKHNA